MALKVGELFASIKLDDKEYQNTLKNITKSAGAIFLSKKAFDVGKAVIDYSAQIEQLQTSFEVMTGSAEKAADILGEIREIAAKTPFEVSGLAETTQLLMNYGFTAETALERMTMLGDIAQGNEEKLKGIATAYGQMNSAGKVLLQDIKQMIERGFNPLQIISESTGESMASLYDRISNGTLAVEEITAAMVTATSEGGKYFQSMEKQAQTLNGQLSTLKDNSMELLSDVFQPLFDSIRTDILPELNNTISDLAKGFEQNGIEGLASAFYDTFTGIVDALIENMDEFAGELAEGVSDFMGDIDWVQVSADIGDFIERLGTLIGSAAGGLLSAAKTLVTKLIEYMLTPEFWVGLGIGLTNILDGIFGGIMGVLEQALGGVTGEEQGGEIDYTLLINADGQVDVGQAIDLSRYHGSGDAMIQYLQDNGYLPKGAIERYDFALSLYPDITFEEAMDNANHELVQTLLEAGMDQNLAAIKMPVAVAPDVSLGIEDGAVFEESISQSLAESGVTPTIETTANVEVSSIQAVTLSEEAVAQFGEAGTQAGQIMSTNISTMVANTEGITAAIDSLAAAAETAASTSMKNAGMNAGKMFSSGIASGILSGKSVITSAARKVAQAAIDAANAKLKIHSPSRVMFESGGFFSEGFAKGIMSAAKSAVSAAAGMATMAANAATIRRPVSGLAYSGAAYGGGLYIDYDRMADAMANYQMIMDLDGKRIAQINARNTDRAQNKRQHSLALGYGISRR